MPPDFAARFTLLSAEFARRQGEALVALDRRLSDQGPDVPRALLQEAHDLLHRLSGSGGSFGFHELSRQARDLEIAARGWLTAAQPISEPEWQAWKSGVHALAQTLEPHGGRRAQ